MHTFAPRGTSDNPYDLYLNAREIAAFTAYYGFIEEDDWISEMLHRHVRVHRVEPL